MKKILFTTAYSKHSKNVWRYTLELAKYFNAAITLMHVYESDKLTEITDEEEYLAFDADSNDTTFAEQQAMEETEKLQEFAKVHTTSKYKGIPIDVFATDGFVADSIIKEQERGQYDLVVVGTVTRKLSERIFGSVSIKVLNGVNSSVLLIPPDVAFYGIQKVIYTTNFEERDQVAIQYLLDWIQAFQATLHLLHVSPNSSASKIAKEKMSKLMDNFKQDGNREKMTYQLLEGPETEMIEEYRQFTGSDMIALLSHKKGFFSKLFDTSLTEELAVETMIPLLVLKG